MLELQAVVKHFRGGGEAVRAVDGVSFTVAPGEMVVLLGPSGSGKTTLLTLVAGLMGPDCGTIRYGSTLVSALAPRQASAYLLHEVGFIFQGFHLTRGATALESAARKLVLQGVGLREARARALPWLERVGLSERLESRSEELSGGEAQRVSIARALACEPGLILADEPTANLDSARSIEIVELLQSIARERGAHVLLVTHDRSAAAIADRQCELRDGKLDLTARGETRSNGGVLTGPAER